MKINEVIPEMMEPALPSPSRSKSRPMRRKVKIGRVVSALNGLSMLGSLLDRGISVDNWRRRDGGRGVTCSVQPSSFVEEMLNG